MLIMAYTLDNIPKYETVFLFSEIRAVVPTRAVEVNCLRTVALCPDVTVVNAVWIAISGNALVMGHCRSSTKRNEKWWTIHSIAWFDTKCIWCLITYVEK